ncbi:hypothetical protein ACGFJ7_29610 [Actinoplanes sp. NPDC048988]|uniref:SEL1-like repeat protein n=1 Tax=Actinoplanes sp. NPDC048988 TaxID=3363901 RepID=UPI003712606A
MNADGSPAAGRFFAALAELRRATRSVSYTTLTRRAEAQRLQSPITNQRLSDWFGAKAVPADPAIVRFLVEYLQPKAGHGYRPRELSAWLKLHREAQQERQAHRDKTDLDLARPVLGKAIAECNAIALEVHKAIESPEHGTALPALPAYVRRHHDALLGEVVGDAARGRSRIVTLVGGSSTGKTRAGWEAVQALPAGWLLWHPISPSRPDALKAALDDLAPRTVIWLNDAQHYLITAGPSVGERIAAAIREALTDDSRRPILVVATMWPEFWAKLTAPPSPGHPDPHSQARELLAGTDLPVPDRFTTTDLSRLRPSEDLDPRLRQAAAFAQKGRVTQYLAGVPGLIQRYQIAPPAARALMDAAIDLRRFGHGPMIPRSLLEHAAPGYLDDDEWQLTPEDWFEQASAFTAAPCHGVPGPLVPFRPRSDDEPRSPAYKLADYVEQAGRRDRAAVFPPETFWQAASSLTDPDVLRRFGSQAEARMRYGRAVQLYWRAVDLGSTSASGPLGWRLECAGDRDEATALYQRAAESGDSMALRSLARMADERGDHAGADDLYRRAADSGDVVALWHLAWRREEAGDLGTAVSLYRRAADKGHLMALRDLAVIRKRANDQRGVEALFREAAERGDTNAFAVLAEMRERAGDEEGALAIAVQALRLGDSSAIRGLTRTRERAGDQGGAERVARRALADGDSSALQALAELREEGGRMADAERFFQEAAETGDTGALRGSTRLRELAGDHDGAARFARRALAGGDSAALRDLAELREEADDPAGAVKFYREAAEAGDLTALAALARLSEQAGERDRAYALALEAANRGDTMAMSVLAEMRQDRDGIATAKAVARFGLTDDGMPAASADLRNRS